MKKSLYNFKGITLMEIVVVLGLSLLLLLIIYSSFLISHKSFNTSDTRLELIQNGRILLDRLSRELRQSVEIVTPLPPTKSEPGFPPPNEILFQDGHGLEDIQYLKYFLDNTTIKRQRIVYFFQAEPDVYVYWNVEDEFGNPPQSQILEERIIAEYFTTLLFYGENLTNIEITLEKRGFNLHLFTSVWGRNERQ